MAERYKVLARDKLDYEPRCVMHFPINPTPEYFEELVSRDGSRYFVYVEDGFPNRDIIANASLLSNTKNYLDCQAKKMCSNIYFRDSLNVQGVSNLRQNIRGFTQNIPGNGCFTVLMSNADSSSQMVLVERWFRHEGMFVCWSDGHIDYGFAATYSKALGDHVVVIIPNNKFVLDRVSLSHFPCDGDSSTDF